MRAAFLNVHGVSTRYLSAGEGHPLILLHGVGLSADTWFRNLDELGRERRAIALDMLGHGFTAAVSWGEAAPHPVLVDHILAFADALGLTRFSIVGSSFGAQIATLVYLKAPDRVTDLVIVGSGSSFNTEEEQAETLARVYENAMKALSDPTWESCRQRLANICYDEASVPNEVILPQLTSYARPGVAEAYKATVQGMTDLNRARPYRILERLEETVVRTLIIWGRQDTRGRLDRALAASRRIADCEIEVFEQCGHLPYVEHPQKFNAIIGAFLDGYRRVPGWKASKLSLGLYSKCVGMGSAAQNVAQNMRGISLALLFLSAGACVILVSASGVKLSVRHLHRLGGALLQSSSPILGDARQRRCTAEW